MARVTGTSNIVMELTLLEARILANFLLCNLPVNDYQSTPASFRDQLQDVLGVLREDNVTGVVSERCNYVA